MLVLTEGNSEVKKFRKTSNLVTRDFTYYNLKNHINKKRLHLQRDYWRLCSYEESDDVGRIIYYLQAFYDNNGNYSLIKIMLRNSVRYLKIIDDIIISDIDYELYDNENYKNVFIEYKRNNGDNVIYFEDYVKNLKPIGSNRIIKIYFDNRNLLSDEDKKSRVR